MDAYLLSATVGRGELLRKNNNSRFHLLYLYRAICLIHQGEYPSIYPALITVSLNINRLQGGIAIASHMDEENNKMEDLRGIIRDAIEAAKESGLWQCLSLKEKESVVKFIYHMEVRNGN
jgi:hypothetical protein